MRDGLSDHGEGAKLTPAMLGGRQMLVNASGCQMIVAALPSPGGYQSAPFHFGFDLSTAITEHFVGVVH